ncbi:hypothetical protein [Amorphus coralli]|uniref:hypothetical protein n=1 Tax=Amorphus coralli TaxID=340680 RepID=UPI00037B8C59|nr:hypothetical protein [Amorphus coralli]
MSDDTDQTVSAFRVTVPETDGTMLAALRLGTYLAEEDDWIDTSISLSDGFYLMTDAKTTTNVDGDSFLYSGKATSITGDKSISILDAGETSFRAHTVSFGANTSPSTVNASVNLEATNMVTLQSETDVTINCENLVYVVEESFNNKTASNSYSISQGEVGVAVGASVSATLMASFDIESVGFVGSVFSQSLAIFSISSSAAELSGQSFKMANHGLKAFLCGIFLPLTAADARAVGVDNQGSQVSARDSGIDSSESGAQSDINSVSVSANSLSSTI